MTGGWWGGRGGLEVNTEEINEWYMIVSRQQNESKNYDVHTANISFESVVEF